MTAGCSETALYWEALSRVKGMDVAMATALLERVPSPEAYFSMSEAGLESLFPGSSYNSYAVRQGLLQQARCEMETCSERNVWVRGLGDASFPCLLAACDDAPVRIFGIGDCDLNVAHRVAVVGTRRCTPWGVDFTTSLVRDLSQAVDGLVIISGLAYGTDVTAHKAALAEGVPTVAVVAHGMDTIYPAEHRSVAARIVREGGAVVTEYPLGTRIHRSNFLARNRIIAGMADITIVVESDIRGGAMSTARFANLYNREVGAVPGRVTDQFSRGTNALVFRNMASVVRDADDVVALMNWQRKPQASPQKHLFPVYTTEQQVVVDYLRANPDHTVNKMCAALNMSYAALSALLMEMEMDDIIVGMPGGRYMVR